MSDDTTPATLAPIFSDETKMPTLFAALAAAQAEFPKIEKTKKAEIRPRDASKTPYVFYYADLDEILTKMRPVLASHGLAVIQPVLTDSGGDSWLATILTHREGGSLTSRVRAPDPTDDPKVYGGLLTFMRRYMYCAMLCIAADDDLDDDGNGHGGFGDDSGGEASATTRTRPSQPRTRAAVETKGAGAVAVIDAGRVKWVQARVAALGIEGKDVAAMLKRYGVTGGITRITLAVWPKIEAELQQAGGSE